MIIRLSNVDSKDLFIVLKLRINCFVGLRLHVCQLRVIQYD